MSKELKESLRIMPYLIKNINEEIFNKKNQIEILELKSSITKTKILLERVNTQFELAEDRI